MRIHRGLAMLAAVLSLAGISAPVAYGFDNRAPSGGSQVTPIQVQQGSAGSNDWLIAVGAAGGLTAIGAGAAAKRRHSQRHGMPVTTA